MPNKYILYLIKKQNARNGLLPGKVVAVYPDGYVVSKEDRDNHHIIYIPASEFEPFREDYLKGIDLYYSRERKQLMRM